MSYEFLPYCIMPLVAFAVSMAIERSGPRFGGTLSAVPVIAGAALLATANEADPQSVRLIAFSGLLGTYATLALLRVYAGVCRDQSPALSLVLALLAAIAGSLVLLPLAAVLSKSSTTRYEWFALISVLLIGSIALASHRRLWPQASHADATPQASSFRKRMVIRVIAGSALGYAAMAANATFGALVAGTLLALPVTSLPQIVIQHRMIGGESSQRFILGRNRAHGVQVTFFATLCVALDETTVAIALTVAFCLSLTYFAVVSLRSPRVIVSPLNPQ